MSAKIDSVDSNFLKVNSDATLRKLGLTAPRNAYKKTDVTQVDEEFAALLEERIASVYEGVCCGIDDSGTATEIRYKLLGEFASKTRLAKLFQVIDSEYLNLTCPGVARIITHYVFPVAHNFLLQGAEHRGFISRTSVWSPFMLDYQCAPYLGQIREKEGQRAPLWAHLAVLTSPVMTTLSPYADPRIEALRQQIEAPKQDDQPDGSAQKT